MEWQPPGLRPAQILFKKFNINIEVGLRGGGVGKFKYSECSGLAEAKLCFRLEAFANAEYKTKDTMKQKNIKPPSFGIGANGGCNLCLNLCNGEIKANCSVSFSAYIKFGTDKYDRTYSFGKDLFNSREYYLGRINTLALLEPYCNLNPNPYSCCCQK